MDAFLDYASSDDEDDRKNKNVSSPTESSLPIVNSAPLVAAAVDPYTALAAAHLAASSSTQLTVNMPVDSTLAPFHGPANAYARNASQSNPALVGGGKEIVTGVIERTDLDDFSFEAQYHTYNQRHTGMEVPTDRTVASTDDTVFTKPKHKAADKKKEFKDEFGDEATDGIWAPFKEKPLFSDAEAGTLTEEQEKLRQERIEAKKRKAEERTATEFDEDMDFDRMVEKKNGHLLPARLKAGQKAMEGRTEFLGDQEYDYLGRSWVEPPRGVKPDEDAEHQVFLPKKCIHKWAGHTKGVQAIELFPKYGHLVLSGSLDNTVRIWDVYNERQCKRVYEGHTGAVRGINMSNDGRQFLSCGFDRFIQLWDTETGQAIKSFTNRRVPYCIKFHPEDNTNFVIGDSNNMVVQFDTRSGEIVQEYNHHLQAVNSVTFVDDNRRFVSTSDDKKILIWEWGIPVPIKYISEPSMHSMPAVTLHPSGGFFAGQSLNNQIDVYTARDKFKIQRKKVFKGHANAGYACQLNFSPNGQYLVSGDGEGKLCFWDWKSTKMYKKLRAHDRGPCMGVAWHPLEPSQVVSCGWDGLIKLWD